MRKRFDLSVTARCTVTAIATFCWSARVFASVASAQGARPRTSCVLTRCGLARRPRIAGCTISTGATTTTVTTCTSATRSDR